MTTFKAKGLTSIANTVDTSNFIFLKSTAFTADQLGNTVSLSLNAAAVTGAAMTNHSLFLNAGIGSGLETPFQLQIPDSSHLYIYKRWYTSGAWSEWSKISAGQADTWTTARTLTIGNTGKTVDGSANVSWSKDEILGGSGTTAFLRADKSWTSTLTGPFYSTGSPGFQNVTAAGTWAYLQLTSGTLGWDIASSSSQNSGALDFRPHKSTNHGIMISQNGGLYFRNPATEGIYYQGTKVSQRMIRFIDNTSDGNGNGISIGGGGQTIIGGGESANTLTDQAGTDGAEIMQIGNDGSIEMFANLQNGYSTANYKKLTWDTTGRLTAENWNTGQETGVSVRNATSGYDIRMIVNNGTTPDVGIYSGKHGNWLVRQTKDGHVYYLDGYNKSATRLAYSQSALAASAITYLACWNGYEIRAISKGEMANAVDGQHKWVRIGGDTMTGNLIITGTGDKYCEVKCTDTSCRVELDNSGGNHGLWSSGYWNGSSYTGSSVWFMYRGTDSYAHCGTRLYNAVWNDFAEYRQGETMEGGRAVYDDGTGIMKITTKRLQPAARIISDTFGMAVGESDKAKTPIGVSGRVLAYPYKNRTKYNVGDAVCAAPNGTVDIMTREEIMMYPDRIIGIVSEIPTYDIWRNTLKNEEFGSAEVIVNGRIWVYVK